jgi:hypothetical protein
MAAISTSGDAPVARKALTASRSRRNRMPDNTVLCWNTSLKTNSGHVTVADYIKWRDAGELGKAQLARFINERLSERYLEPINALSPVKRNSFAIMAISCLLIETLESIYQGWETSPTSSQAFRDFFDRQDEFQAFRPHAVEFYKRVRCGILHQGETTKGWSLSRAKGAPLLDEQSLTVNATAFHRRMARAVDRYSAKLLGKTPEPTLWPHFYKKMNATIKNCG